MIWNVTGVATLKPALFPALGSVQRASTTSRKQILAPGHSPLDWARLTTSGKDLRGVPRLGHYTAQEVKSHRYKHDAWTILNGRVYNITHYMPFHPGGEKDLMRIAGRDGTQLFRSFIGGD
jgi:cytochrome b involved in lipid metabolism